jgi:hypothetical protein
MVKPRSRSRDADIVDAYAEGLVGAVTSTETNAPGAAAQDEARRGSLDGSVSVTSRALVVGRERALYGSKAFFRRAAEELVLSTRTGRELAGSCYLKEKDGRVLLVGLKREVSGMPGRVPIDPTWGAALWHTHPGLKGSLAAFSLEDLDVARQSNKPLLVIGFVGFSLDVLSTLALPFGLKAALASGGIKALLALERSGKVPTKLLEYGVGARVCWPRGTIQPVMRQGATPFQAAVDDMSFALDRGVGAVERVGQRALREVLNLVMDRKKP